MKNCHAISFIHFKTVIISFEIYNNFFAFFNKEFNLLFSPYWQLSQQRTLCLKKYFCKLSDFPPETVGPFWEELWFNSMTKSQCLWRNRRIKECSIYLYNLGCIYKKIIRFLQSIDVGRFPCERIKNSFGTRFNAVHFECKLHARAPHLHSITFDPAWFRGDLGDIVHCETSLRTLTNSQNKYWRGKPELVLWQR